MSTELLEAPTAQRKGITPAANRTRRKRLPCAPGELPEVEYKYNPCFDDHSARADIVADMPDKEKYDQKCADIRLPKNVPPELIGTYLFPLLSREQEAHLFRQMNYYKHLAALARLRFHMRKEKHRVAQSLLNRDEQEYRRNLELGTSVQKLLVSSNTRLVYNFVRKMGLSGNDYFEATQEAMFPLMSSVLKFDYSKGNRFSTYCMYALLNWRSRYNELAGRRDLTNMEDGFLIAMAGAEEDEEAEDNDMRSGQLSLLKTMFSKLDDREKKIVRLRMGLGALSPKGKKEWTLDEVGEEVGITKERVRQIQVLAFKKMKKLKPIEMRRAQNVLARFGLADAV